MARMWVAHVLGGHVMRVGAYDVWVTLGPGQMGFMEDACGPGVQAGVRRALRGEAGREAWVMVR